MSDYSLVVPPQPKKQGGSRFAVRPIVKITLLLKGSCKRVPSTGGLELSLEPAGKSYRYHIDDDNLEVVALAALHEGLVIGVEGPPADIFQLMRGIKECSCLVYGEPIKKHLTVKAKDINEILAASNNVVEFGERMGPFITAQERRSSGKMLVLLSRKKFRKLIAKHPTLENTLVCRTKKHFRWPVRRLGIMLLDHDLLKPERFPGGITPEEPKTPLEFIEYISKAAPNLFTGVCFTTLWSSSAFIYRNDIGDWVTGRAGIHVGLVVDKPTNIDAVIKLLWSVLALFRIQGLFLEVSKAGAILKKTFLDKAPVSVNHLDFAGKAVFPPQPHAYAPLSKLIPPGETILENPGGHPFNTAEFLSSCQIDERRLRKLLRKLEKNPEIQKFARERRQEHIEKLVIKELLKHPNATDDEKAVIRKRITREFISMSQHRKIGPNTIIYFDEFTFYTVAYILEHLDDFVDSGCCSPTEPDYENYHRSGTVKIDTETEKYVIVDHSHGMRRVYTLCADEDDCDFIMPSIITAEVDDADGENDRPAIFAIKGLFWKACVEAEEILHEQETFFNYTGQICMLSFDSVAGLTIPVRIDSPRFMRELSRYIMWMVWNVKAATFLAADPPPAITKALTQEPFDHIARLIGMAHSPFFKRPADGGAYELVQTTGYCPDTFTFSTCNPADYNVKLDATLEDAKEALQLIHGDLLNAFCFKDRPLGLSQATAAMLQSTIRVSIDIAPAFVITSPEAGGGKGTLAATILRCGSPGKGAPSSMPYNGNDTPEFIKVFISSYDSGAVYLYFANVKREEFQEQSSLSESLSAPTIAGRILGLPVIRRFSTRIMVVIEGIQLVVPPDLVRKTIVIELDPDPNQKYKKMGFPVWAMENHREKYINALLTIIQAYINHVKVHGRIKTEGEVASYSTDWQFLIREPLVWLGLVDPARELIASAKGIRTDDLSILRRDIVVAWYEKLAERDLTREFGAKQFIALLVSLGPSDTAMGELLDALREHFPTKDIHDSGGVNRHALGIFLAGEGKKRVFYEDGSTDTDLCYLRLKVSEKISSTKKYCVEVLWKKRDEPDPGDEPPAPVVPSGGSPQAPTAPVVPATKPSGLAKAKAKAKPDVVAKDKPAPVSVDIAPPDFVATGAQRYSTKELTILHLSSAPDYSAEDFKLLSSLVRSTCSWRHISQTQWECLYPNYERDDIPWPDGGPGEPDFGTLVQRRNFKIDETILKVARGAKVKKDYFSLLGEVGVVTPELAFLLESVYWACISMKSV